MQDLKLILLYCKIKGEVQLGFLLENSELELYLKESEIIDYHHSRIQTLVEELKTKASDEINYTKEAFEFVRDAISHSGDIQARQVTCKASEVLLLKHGNCCGKSHLLAAILRAAGIPTGFCYQMVLSDEVDNLLLLHGLNAVFLRTINRWIRLDARGNNENVNAQFNLESEQLAWPIRSELGERDGLVIYSVPKEEVVYALLNADNRQKLGKLWPREIVPR